MKSSCIIAVAFYAILSSADADTTNRVPMATQDVAICEAVFLFQIPLTMQRSDTNAIYALCIESSDPDDILMENVRIHDPRLIKQSEIPRAQRHLATTLFIEAIEWTDATHVQIEGGYSEPGNNISKDRYFLENVDGTWTVVKCVTGLRAGG